jgi:proteic killer suppression protein
MKVRFADKDWERLETEFRFNRGLAPGLVKAYRKRIQFIRAARDERDLRQWASLRFERLGGNRCHQHSMRLNDQWRLIVEIETKGSDKAVRVVGVEDYHR